MTLPAYAAGEVGKLNDTSYTSFSSLVNDLKNNYKNKTVTIQMSDDWDAAKNSVFDKQLVIPGGCRATLDMQGHLFSRNMSGSNKWENNGELIRVEDKATLTINGGDRTHHTVKVYNSSDRSKKADASYNAEGGTLAGGASTNGGGGIHVKSDATLTMNSVTIAGCRESQRRIRRGLKNRRQEH